MTTLLIFLMNILAYSQVDKKTLVSKIEDKIANYYIETFNISVDENDVVTIEGEVGILYDKLKIGELISQVEGVKEVNNKITVRNEITADDIIKVNIEDELQRNDAILEPKKIKVEVNDGVVTLSSTVSYFREKQMAQTIASWQDGVSDLKSNLVVMSPVSARSDDNLKEIISDILDKNYPLEKNVKFDVSNGEVDLYGSTRSLYAKKHIQEDIQHLLGVNRVINTIEVIKDLE